MDTKAQQISINFLVRFILAMVLFGLGVIFMWNIYDASTGTSEGVQGEFDRRIATLNCKPTETVCVNSNKFEIGPGERVLVDLKLSNPQAVDLTYDLDIQIRNSEDEVIVGEGYTQADYLEIVPAFYHNQVVESKGELDRPFLISTTNRMTKGSYVARIVVENVACGTQCLPEVIKRIQFDVK